MNDTSAPPAQTRRCPTCGEMFSPPLVLCPRDASVLEREPGEAHDPLIGRVFGGRFAILSRLGEGGMGAVYRATQLSVGREVALKVLHPSFAARDDAAQRFAREARLLSRIHHPSVVTLFDFGQAESGELFLAMELLQGQTLAARLERGALDRKTALLVADGIAQALAIAHADGIVHRDLKPENVWLVPRPGSNDVERVKVLDFGLARSVAMQTTTLTAAGTLFGTPAYMAPEVIAGREVGPAADLYALGLVLYEMLVGKKVFEREHIEAVFTAHLVDTPPALPPEFPRALSELVRRLLDKDPTRRLASPDDVRAALVAIDETNDPQRSRTTAHTESRTAGRLAAPTAEQAAPRMIAHTEQPMRVPSPERPRRGMVVAGVVATALVAGGLFVLASTSGDGPGAAATGTIGVVDAGSLSVADTAATAPITTVASETARTPDVVSPDTTLAAASVVDVTSAADAAPSAATNVDTVAAVVAPKPITLSLTSTPVADVRLDDEPLGKTPVTWTGPPEDREATLRFTRAGYKPVVKKVRLDADQSMKVELTREVREDFIMPRSPP